MSIQRGVGRGNGRVGCDLGSAGALSEPAGKFVTGRCGRIGRETAVFGSYGVGLRAIVAVGSVEANGYLLGIPMSIQRLVGGDSYLCGSLDLGAAVFGRKPSGKCVTGFGRGLQSSVRAVICYRFLFNGCAADAVEGDLEGPGCPACVQRLVSSDGHLCAGFDLGTAGGSRKPTDERVPFSRRGRKRSVRLTVGYLYRVDRSALVAVKTNG